METAVTSAIDTLCQYELACGHHSPCSHIQQGNFSWSKISRNSCLTPGLLDHIPQELRRAGQRKKQGRGDSAWRYIRPPLPSMILTNLRSVNNEMNEPMLDRSLATHSTCEIEGFTLVSTYLCLYKWPVVLSIHSEWRNMWKRCWDLVPESLIILPAQELWMCAAVCGTCTSQWQGHVSSSNKIQRPQQLLLEIRTIKNWT